MIPEKINIADRKLFALHKPEMERLASNGFFIFAGENTHRQQMVIDGDVAIISVRGLLFRYEEPFVGFTGGTSIESLTTRFEHALNDSAIKTIILDINSPGGEVDGTPEFAEYVYASRGRKPIYAYVSSIGASAAYWIASAADRVIVQETAAVGSIGVYGTYLKSQESDGEITIVSSVSPNKIPDLSTDEGITQVKRHVDALGEIFVRNVARYRGVTPAEVLNHFGRGDVRMGHDAVAFGMADEVGSLRSILSTRGGGMQTSTSGKEDQEKVEITREWIEKNKPEIAEELREEGAKRELSRIREIETLNEESSDAVGEEAKAYIAVAKFESRLSSGDVARGLVHINAQKRRSLSVKRREDANGIPKIANTGSHDEASSADRKSVVEAIRAGFTAGRRK